MKKLIIISISALAIVVVAGLLYTFRTGPDSVKNNKPDFTLAANELVNVFETSEAIANTQFNNKVLLVQGTITQIEKNEDGSTIVNLQGTTTGNVSCLFSAGEKTVASIQTGEAVQVKGLCTGYLMDVVITKCCIVK